MHIKFLARGTGSAAAAADYLLGERDATGNPREGVEVLRGNPDMVAAVADSLDFEHRYTSGVIAWAPDDQPTDEQIEAVSRRLRGDGLGRARARPLRMGGGAAPRARTAARTCMSWPRAAIWRPGEASTSPLRVGGRRLIRSATPSTTSTVGAVRTIRRGPGWSSPATAPTSRRHGCGPDSGSNPPPAT